jgi:dihydroorotate dehydrogenase (fumarate)
VRRLEDAGAPMIVLRSLFEEQVVGEQLAFARALDAPTDSFAEAATWLPEMPDFRLGPDEYLAHLERVKAAVRVPVVASLNGTTPGGWLDFAARIERAGADALELNLYELATDPDAGSEVVEARLVDVVKEVRRRVQLPLAVKLSPFVTSLPSFAKRLVAAGANGLVLFNRFYQPDLDPAELEIKPDLRLSSPAELTLRLRWIAILHGRAGAALALTGGAHHAVDVVKGLFAGASIVQVVSALLMHGPEHLAVMRSALADWLEEHEHERLAPMIGALSSRRCADPHLLERSNYARTLQSWRPR